MASGWYIRRGSKLHGPVSTEQLKKLAATGKLKPDDQLAQSKAGPYRTAAKAKGLFPARKKAKPAEDEFVEAVVIEEDEYGSYDDAVDYDAYGAVDDYDDYDDYEDVVEEPPPSRGRRSRSAAAAPPKPKSSKASKSKPKKSKTKAKKKSSDDDDEEEDGPWWLNALWGTGCIAVGIFLCVMALNKEAAGEEVSFGRKGGIFKLIYSMLGPWGLLGVLCLAGCGFYYAAYDSYQKENS